jgi:copper(I)-binding protein
MKKNLVIAGAIAALALSLVGCSSDDTASATTVSINDAYVKSASMEPMDMGSDKSMDMGSDKSMDKDTNNNNDAMEMEPMSAAFMTITNDTGEEVTLVGGSTDVSERVEIHEVVDGVMRPIDGGLVIADGTTSTLKPGGNHVMLMGLTQDLKAGDEVSLTLKFADGESVKVTAPVKDVSAGEEPYATSSPKA